jgi:hypothetical protein
MILDKRTEFGDSFSITNAAATLLFTNQIDLNSAGRDIGNGEPLYLVIQIDEAVVGTTSTIEFRLRSDDSASIHATTSTGHWTSGAIPEATLVAGYTMIVPLPLGTPAYERYLGLQAIVAVNTTTAGKASAFLTTDPSKYTLYPNAI